MNDITHIIDIVNDWIKPSSMIEHGFIYGSRIYGTNKPDADYDVVLFSNDESLNDFEEQYISDEISIDVHIKSYGWLDEQFKQPSDILIIEMKSYFNIDNFSNLISLGEYTELFFKESVDRSTMRHVISSIVSNAYVKAKKKLAVEDSYDRYASMKSLYHCYRLLDYGIQVGQHGSIVDFKSTVPKYIEICEYYNHGDTYVFEKIHGVCKQELNSLKTEFRKYFPKD